MPVPECCNGPRPIIRGGARGRLPRVGAALSPSEVGVGARYPVGARWREDIEVDGVFQRLGFVRQIGRDYQHFTGTHGDHSAITEREAQGAFQDVSDLLILMAVLRHQCAAPKRQARQHGAFSVHKLAIDRWIQVIDRNGVETRVLQVVCVWQKLLLASMLVIAALPARRS